MLISASLARRALRTPDTRPFIRARRYVPELTPEAVALMAQEAAILESCGQHPNIVRTLGVCVLPPSLALVLELCEEGDLFSCAPT